MESRPETTQRESKDLQKSLQIFKLIGITNEYHGYDQPTGNATGADGSDGNRSTANDSDGKQKPLKPFGYDRPTENYTTGVNGSD